MSQIVMWMNVVFVLEIILHALIVPAFQMVVLLKIVLVYVVAVQ